MAVRWDWTDISDETVAEITRQGELRLADTLSISNAADQRATTLSAVFAAIGAGIAAADGAYITTKQPDLAVTAALAVMWLILLVASAICIYAARPIEVDVRGYEPGLLMQVAINPSVMMRDLCESLEPRIIYNKKICKRSARLTTIGSVVAVLSVLFGALTFALLRNP
jgi:hypothetical protein